MTAYVIAEIDITNREAYKAYQAADADSVARHGGRFVVQGGRGVALEGVQPKHVIVIEFASIEAANRWYNSPDYKDARTIRAVAAKSRFLLVEGA